MTKVLVLGNGESRKNLDLSKFKDEYTTIGCNAIVREFFPDAVVCCDIRMAQEAALSHKVPVYVRPENLLSLNRIEIFKPLPNIPYVGTQKQDQPQHWGSGPYAVLLATELGFPTVVLAGFDLYSKNGKINNLYKGSTHYLPSTANAVDPAYWIYQIGKIIELNPYVEFIILNEEGWQMPTEWQKDNVTFKNISEYTVDSK